MQSKWIKLIKIKKKLEAKLQGIENILMLLADTSKQPVPSDVHASEEVMRSLN